MKPDPHTMQIRHVVEPKRLLLVWQAPDGDPRASRTRHVVGELVRSGNLVTLRYCKGKDDFENALRDGFEGHPAFPLRVTEYTSSVMDVLLRRLPPRSRADYARYLTNLALSPGQEVSDFALLGYSEAKLPSDGFSVINAFEECPVPCEFLTEVAGFRYYAGPRLHIEEGDSVTFEAEPENPVDPNAVRIMLRGDKIGFVNRVQASAFHCWLQTADVSGRAYRINGTEARPRLVIFVEVDGRSPSRLRSGTKVRELDTA